MTEMPVRRHNVPRFEPTEGLVDGSNCARFKLAPCQPSMHARGTSTEEPPVRIGSKSTLSLSHVLHGIRRQCRQIRRAFGTARKGRYRLVRRRQSAGAGTDDDMARGQWPRIAEPSRRGFDTCVIRTGRTGDGGVENPRHLHPRPAPGHDQGEDTGFSVACTLDFLDRDPMRPCDRCDRSVTRSALRKR